MRRSITLLIGIAVLAIAIGSGGCTLIGYSIGSTVDDSNAEDLILPPDAAMSMLDAGDEIVCIMGDGTSHNGTYAGVRTFGESRSMRLLTPEKLWYLDFAEIDAVSFRYEPSSGRTTYTFLGVVADAAIVAAIASSLDKSSPSRGSVSSGSTGSTSSSSSSSSGSSKSKGGWMGTGYDRLGCPIVEGWDGGAWQREAECLTGSFYRAARRSDVARLPHAVPEDGVLRLRVHDMLPETDSIDRFSVLAVEHPAGTVVYPTEEGRLLAVSPRSPRTAADDLGRDILPRLLRDDDEAWLALPVADPSRRGERRAFECRFPLPADADSVTLLLRVRNTWWGSDLQTGFLSMYGSELQALYDRLNTDDDRRAFLRRRFEEEGMLAISVWDGAEWRCAGTVWEVGPEAWRDVARRIDVRGIDAEELRIRFDAPAAIWLVDRVAFDAAPLPAIDVAVLSASRAKDSDGRDRSADLAAADGRYVSLETGDWVEAAYRVPDDAPAPGIERSYLLELSGYYRAKLSPEGPPQADLIARILGEPGFFAKYADGRFWESVVAMGDGR